MLKSIIKTVKLVKKENAKNKKVYNKTILKMLKSKIDCVNDQIKTAVKNNKKTVTFKDGMLIKELHTLYKKHFNAWLINENTVVIYL